jgi:hypothetical protein
VMRSIYSRAAGAGILFYGLLEVGSNGLKYRRPLNRMKRGIYWAETGSRQNGRKMVKLFRSLVSCFRPFHFYPVDTKTVRYNPERSWDFPFLFSGMAELLMCAFF